MKLWTLLEPQAADLSASQIASGPPLAAAMREIPWGVVFIDDYSPTMGSIFVWRRQQQN